MKVRNGFVSNSSSSSFVVLIPKNFNIDNVDWSKFKGSLEDYEETIEDVKQCFKTLIEEGYTYSENDEGYCTLTEVLEPFIVAEVESGCSGEGGMVIANKEKIKRLLSED